MDKKDIFPPELQELAAFARVVSHPARLAILKYLAETPACITGDISQFLPLSRTTVSQHLKELRRLGLIHGEIDGLKVNYCLCKPAIRKHLSAFGAFFDQVEAAVQSCDISHC